jgi:hypothetical protein
MDLEMFILMLLRKSAIEMIDSGKAPVLEDVRKRIECSVGLYWDNLSDVVLTADSEKVTVTFSLDGRKNEKVYPHERVFLWNKWLGVKDAGKKA